MSLLLLYGAGGAAPDPSGDGGIGVLEPSTNFWNFFLIASPSWDAANQIVVPAVAIGDLTHAHDKSLDLNLNQPGSFTFKLHGSDDLANSVQPIITGVQIYKNNQMRWSGMVWTVEDTLPDGYMSVSCKGWAEILNHRFVYDNLSYGTTATPVDAGQIAFNLLDHTNVEYPTLITPGILQESQGRVKSYQKFQQNIGQEIQLLSDIESGYDYEVDPETLELNIYTIKETDRSNTIFSYGWGSSNLKSVQRTIDSSTIANYMYVLGKFGSVLARDIDNVLIYGGWEDISTLSDISDQNILEAYANAEIAVRTLPRVIYNLTPQAYSANGPVPSIFEDYEIGDKAYLIVKSDRIDTGSTPQAIRIFGATVSVDDDGNEIVTSLRTSPS